MQSSSIFCCYCCLHFFFFLKLQRFKVIDALLAATKLQLHLSLEMLPWSVHDGCGGCAQITTRREGRPLCSTYRRWYWSACCPPSYFSRAWPASSQPSSITTRRVRVQVQALHVYDILPSNHSHKWLRHRSHWFAPPSLQTLPYLVMPRS